MDAGRFSSLLEKFLADTLGADELSDFLSATADPANSKLLYDTIGDKIASGIYTGLSKDTDIDRMFEEVLAKANDRIKEEAIVVQLPAKKKRFAFSGIAAASAILVLLLGSLYLLISHEKETPQAVQSTPDRFKNDVAPGHRGAVLTLSDGQQIVLDSVGNGVIASQGNTDIVKDGNGLAYTKNKNAQVVYNTVTTPNGRQYSLVLSDGSKVWLNTASSITYPTAFTGNERKVSITGEVYFEVAHNDRERFVVEKGNTRVQVLGTHFNINSYEDEDALMVTLLEGALEVTSKATSDKPAMRLRPGQQAQVMTNGGIKMTGDINTAQVVAWKNERFLFESANIRTIMRQVARWYNVKVVYEADIPYAFVADISMNLPVSELLKLLELTGGVHFKIEGKTITVMK